MKKFVLVLFIAIAAGSMAWGATIGITVNAASKLDVSVDPVTWTIALDNSGTAIQNDNQGTLTVHSSKSSYTVTFTATNGGTLVNGANSIAYYIKVDTSSWSTYVTTNNLSSYTQLQSAKTIVFSAKTPSSGKALPIGFQIPEYADYYADGAYTGTITVSIAQS